MYNKQNKADTVWIVGFWAYSRGDDQLVKIVIEEILQYKCSY